MTQITVTLDKGADTNLIRKFIENVKGVVGTSVSYHNDEGVSKKKTDLSEEKREWVKELHKLVKNVDRSVIDMNDDKTRYIMSK